MAEPNRFVIVSGPSCAGKSPLQKTFEREHPDLAEPFRSPVLYNSRSPRAGERDGETYHFRTRERIEALRDEEDHLVFEVRNDLQAIDVGALREMARESEIFYEGNPEIALALRDHEALAHLDTLDVFVAPLSRAEIGELREGGADVREVVTELMRRRLLRRSFGKNAVLSLPELEDVEVRAKSAYGDLERAHRFRWVLPLHDGEDSDHWSFPRPLGDARRAVRTLAALLRGEEAPALERWDAETLSG